MSSWGNIEPDTKMRNIGGGYGWFQFHSLQLKTKVCKNAKTSFLPLKKEDVFILRFRRLITIWGNFLFVCFEKRRFP